MSFTNWLRKKRYERQHRRNIIIPSPKDKRDIKYTRTGTIATTTDIDLRPGLSSVRNQGSINCCFSFAGAGIIESLMIQKTRAKYVISPSYNYYWTRIIEGTYPNNVGCYITTYMKSLYKYGFVWESLMPYRQVSAYSPDTKTVTTAMMAKELFLSRTEYQFVSPSLYLNALNNNKPILLGIRINKSWYSVGKNGIIDNLDTSQGGHAVLLVGRKKLNDKQYGIIKNSWGEQFGDLGYCYIPWSHLLSNSFDGWTINYK